MGTRCELNINECFSEPCQYEGLCVDLNNSYTCNCSDGFVGTNCETNINECSSSPCVQGSCIDQINGFTCFCSDGFMGIRCELNINECISEPCQYGGLCLDVNSFYTCSCNDGFTGTNCETNINECSSSPCLQGSCIDRINGFTCFCRDGFMGTRCEIDINECISEPCQYGGSCVDLINSYTCNCNDGFLGTNCESNINECSSNPCLHGSCIDRINGFTCFCSDGFMGTNCELNINECASEPCQYGGLCSDMINSYTCNCNDGFTGTNCETNINECSSSPCLQGTCIDWINSFTCFCSVGDMGKNCELNINECASEPCQYGGLCVDLNNSYTCNCSDGFTGTNCETNINECSSNPCLQGSCIDQINGFKCFCSDGFMGATCESNINECSSSPCLQGSCIDQINDFTCNCTDGFMGTRCELDTKECSSSPCLQGSCIDRINGFTCFCNEGFMGTRCEINISECSSSPCLQGSCIDQINGFTCFCSDGFMGTRCEIDINECISEPCQYEGLCLDLNNSYTCNCSDGLTGTNCETNINECISEPCQYGGFCLDLINSYTCNCNDGFTGTNCETNINECISSPCLQGSCIDQINGFKCNCSDGFMGTRCELRTIACGDFYCVYGDCVDVGSCVCNPEYLGRSCDIKRTCSNVTMETEFGQARLPMTEVGIVIDSEELCPEEDSEGLAAPIIRAVCQVSNNGTTSWNASIRCQDYVTRQLKRKLMNGIYDANVKDVAEEVFTITQNYEDITATDIGLLYEILQVIADLNSDANVTGLIVGIVNNVMFVYEDVLASAQENGNYTALIVQVLESQLNTVDVGNSTLDAAYPNLAVKVLDVSSDTAGDGIVITMLSMDTSSLSNSDIMVGTHQDTPTDSVPRDTFVRVVVPIEVGGNAIESLRVAFVGYANDAMFPSPSLALLNRETHEFNSEIDTPVVSLTIGGQKIENLMERVNVTFYRFKPNSSDPTCNFWEFNLVKWSMEGCQVLPDNAVNSFNNEYYTCACDHLTNFAVLVDIYAEDAPPKPVLRLLSIIGCAISIVCLVIAIASYLSVKKIRRSQTHKIFICLCTTLLCLYTVSLAIIALDTEFQYAEVELIPCSVLAALVHYFVLSSLTWMGIEGFNTYLVIIKVFNTYIPKFMIKASIVGWGIPAVIVAATGAITRNYYAEEDYCYIRKWPLIGGLLVPMAIILIINIAVFILAMRRLQNSARMAGRVKKDCKTERQETRERIQNGIAMLLLLGFTWTIGYLTLINVDFTELLFIIFNSLQGFFIFVLYCLRKETIRMQWRRCICCALLREGAGSAESQGNSGGTSRATSGTGCSQPMFESSSTIPHANPSFDPLKLDMKPSGCDD
eukprot:XP_011669492.1 PREDICTED: protein jagged-1 isoform X6 [Strongylocentrotus purpuratus]